MAAADEVLCDPIGFSNHGGECWNDAIQEILLFTDGIKEITQPILHSLHESKLPALIATVQEDLLVPAVAEYAEYIRLMQSRFRIHIAYLQAANRESMAEQKRRLSATCGIEAAAAMAMAIKGTTGGLRAEDRNKVFADLCRIFGVPFVVQQLGLGARTFTDAYHAVFLSAMVYDSKTLESEGGHTVAAFRCNEQWYFFDDNEGVRPISQQVLELCLAEEEFGFFYDSGLLTFVKLQRRRNKPRNASNSRTLTQFVEEGGLAVTVTERLEGDTWKPFEFAEAFADRVYGIKTEEGVYGIRKRRTVAQIMATKKSRKTRRRLRKSRRSRR